MSLLKQLFSRKQKALIEPETQRTLMVDGEEVELAQEAIKFLDIYDQNIEAARAGNGEAQLVIGKALKKFADYYWYGMNRIDEALQWLGLAADKGFASAYTYIGMYYNTDRYEHLDYAKAISLFKKAEELGDAEAVYRLGVIYKYGTGVEKDVYQAFDYFLKAADMGNNDAMEETGKAYYEGNVVEEDKKKAYKYLLEAYKYDGCYWYDFYYYLAQCYLQGDGTEKSPEKAVEILEKVCYKEQYCHEAVLVNLLINCYENGIGTNVDYEKAMKLRDTLRESEKNWNDALSLLCDGEE